jgi:hypothetical protein
MNIREQKINDMIIKPIKFKKEDGEIKGHDIIGDNMFPNIFNVAMKNSGKTTNLFNSLKKIINKETKVYFFVSTFYNDKTYDVIREYLEDKDIYYEAYTNVGAELNNLLHTLTENARIECEQKIIDAQKNIIEEVKVEDITDEQMYYDIFKTDDNFIEQIKLKHKKPKKLAPKYFIIFDDMSEDLRNLNVSAFIKKNRHFKALCWISSQNALDIRNDARNNINIYLLYQNIPEEKLKQLYESCTLPIPYEKFITLYNYATKEQHHFLYINRDTNEYRKNYDIKLIF